MVSLDDPSRTTARFALPEQTAAHEILRHLDVPAEAADEIVRVMPSATRHPEAWWLLERLYAALVVTGTRPPWPAPEPGDDPLTRYFHLYVFLAAMPHVLGLHEARGVPSEVTWATLSDVGLQVAHHHARHGRYGFDGAFWIFNHFRGDLFRLGRLQYELGIADFASSGFAKGDPVLDVHIPALGPLLPSACDASLDAAGGFFARHFPDTAYRFGVCTSWLLDEQLAGVLPEESNIVQFQRRFTHDPDWSAPGDDDTVRFTFGRLPDSLDELPQTTTLERAVVGHLRDGGHWHLRRGWLHVSITGAP